MYTLSLDQTRYLRLRAQRLVPARTKTSDSVAQLVRDVGGLQAQEAPAAVLGVWVRSRGLVAPQVEDARLHERSIVRTWCMRGTLHLLATEDLGWLMPLLGPVFVRKSQRRYAQLGLTDEVCTNATRTIRAVLGEQGPLTRAELADQLAAQGLPTEGQAAYHLLRRAGLEGAICFGPERAGEPTYVLVEDWLHTGGEMAGADPRAELVRRHLAAYGPAGPKDLAAWSGMSISEARAGFESVVDELLEVEIDGSPSWVLKSRAAWLDEPREAEVVVRLLPSYDTYLLGYSSRHLTVPQQYIKRVHPGGGVLRPTLIVDGRAAGTWKLKRGRAGLVVTVEPFENLSAQAAAALEDEVQDLGRFYESDATLSVVMPAI
jgi:uncharacterized protein YcaQ